MNFDAYDEFESRITKAGDGQGDFWVTLDTVRADLDAAYNEGKFSDLEYRTLRSYSIRQHDKLWIARQQPSEVQS
jgi:hypothetical protein